MKIEKFLIYIFFLLFSLIFTSYAEDEKEIDEYLNDCSEAVVVAVPFYSNAPKNRQNINVVLQPGDLYRSNGIQNGCIYEKFGKIPEILTNLVEIEDKFNSFLEEEEGKKVKNDDLKKRKAYFSSNTMPEDWCKRKIDEFNNSKSDLEFKISDFEDEKILRSLKNEYASLTNINEETIRLISVPLQDLDGDGVDNISEYLDDSNPLLKDNIRLSPFAIELTYESNAILTGKFSVSNLSTTNSECTLVLYSRIKGEKFRPELKCIGSIESRTNRFGRLVIDLAPKQTADFVVLFNTKYLPKFLYDFYSVTVYWGHGLNKTAYFYISDPITGKTESVTNLSPPNQKLFFNPSILKFSWSDNDELSNNYTIQIIEFRNGFEEKSFNYTICESNNAAEVTSGSMSSFSPGIYFWRVIKTSFNSLPTPSCWNSFLIGKEVSRTEKKHTTVFKGNILGGRQQDWRVGERKEICLATIKDCVKANYVLPLPKGLSLIHSKGDKSWIISGTPSAAGRYTNTFVMTSSSGKTLKETHIISVYNQPNEVCSLCFYHVNDKEVFYELTVNTNFSCHVKTYFNRFSAKDDNGKIKIGSKVAFKDKLPDGLSFKDDGDDYLIYGIPKKEGVFTNFLTVVNGDNISQERHVFRIKNINEPLPIENKIKSGASLPFIPFPGPPMFVNFSPNKIKHTYNKGMGYKYDVRFDIAATVDNSIKFLMYIKNEKYRDDNYLSMASGKDGYKFKEKQLEANFIYPLRNDIKLKKEDDNYYIYCYPETFLNYTNYLVIRNTEMTYTNMHIFQVIY